MDHHLYQRNDSIRLSGNSDSDSFRSCYRRDYARLIHSAAFRRLQGKTQLFPGLESDFFRNRLTHSLEVAQIAKSIAIKLNAEQETLRDHPIDVDLVEFAGLAHDLGHPPFGHNGEAALDQLMLDHGGFEGNAQTLRILCRLEKKYTKSFDGTLKSGMANPIVNGVDQRLGLDLCRRSIASILKYDRVIARTREDRVNQDASKHPQKGYYYQEDAIIREIKDSYKFTGTTFKTLECKVMDIADDIAYSTYDLEDSFKAGFLTPASMMAMDKQFKSDVAKEVQANLAAVYPDAPDEQKTFNLSDLDSVLRDIFNVILDDENFAEQIVKMEYVDEILFAGSNTVANTSKSFCEVGYYRTHFTSELVQRFLEAVNFEYNPNAPHLSDVRLEIETFKIVETLKHFTFKHLILSPRLRLAEHRGKEIIGKLFTTFTENASLMPEDVKNLYDSFGSKDEKLRVVCDYIAGMTDRYCVEMYSRLTGENPTSFWKPH